jgi:hypothetical protein
MGAPPDTRRRLIEALDAIATSKTDCDYETAFKLLMRYVPGSRNGAVDTELSMAFIKADEALKRGGAH